MFKNKIIITYLIYISTTFFLTNMATPILKNISSIKIWHNRISMSKHLKIFRKITPGF